MPRQSAGLLMYRVRAGTAEVLLVHPGGPFWAKRDEGAWSIPKGEIAPDEDALDRAQTEFREETGFAAEGPFHPLGSVRQPGGKLVHGWACAGDLDPAQSRSNSFRLEWPRGSGRFRTYPEVDRVGWFPLPAARAKLLKGQHALLDRLAALLGAEGADE